MQGGTRKQGSWGPGVAVLSLGALALAVVAVLAQRPQPAAAEPPSPEFFGIAPASAEQLTEAEYAKMEAADVGTLRVAFFWPHIQPPTQAGEPGGDPGYKWGDTDRIVAQAAANGMEVLPFVYGTPSWTAADTRVPPVRSERAREGWDQLFRALVKRYGPDGEFWNDPTLVPPGIDPRPIRAWQIWNEPNSPTFMKQGGNTAQQYALTLDIASRAIRETDPDARVVLAGLFAAPKGGELFERFLGRLFSIGGVAEDFDALGMHPYAPTMPKLRLRFDLAIETMHRHGIGKPLWVTEIGWPTGGTKVGHFRKSPRGQANTLRRSFNLMLARREQWGIQRVIWYTWRDNRLLPSCDICSYSGLFKRKGGPKPAWFAFVDFTGGQP
jgi:hypothetical protein